MFLHTDKDFEDWQILVGCRGFPMSAPPFKNDAKCLVMLDKITS